MKVSFCTETLSYRYLGTLSQNIEQVAHYFEKLSKYCDWFIVSDKLS